MPWVSSLTYVTTLIPLVSVLFITAIKDGIDDTVSLPSPFPTWTHRPLGCVDVQTSYTHRLSTLGYRECTRYRE